MVAPLVARWRTAAARLPSAESRLESTAAMPLALVKARMSKRGRSNSAAASPCVQQRVG